MSENEPNDDRVSPLDWASDVMWAADRWHLKRLDGKTKGRIPNTAPEGISQRRYGLWRLFKENTQEMRSLVPRALAITLKSTGRDDDEEMVAIEEAEIRRIEKIYAAALKEAAGV